MPVKHTGIALPEPTQNSGYNWVAYFFVTVHLVAALRRTYEFRLGDHSLLMVECSDEILWHHSEAAEMVLGETQDAEFT